MAHILTIRKCKLQDNKLLPRGDKESLTLASAVQRFAPSNEYGAKRNVLLLRSGDYIGFIKKDNKIINFIIAKANGNKDISSILKVNPELESKILEVYLVEDVTIDKKTEYLPAKLA